MQLHILLIRLDPLVVVVNGDSQDLLGSFLSDDVLIKGCFNLVRLEKTAGNALALFPFPLLGDDVRTQINTLVAYINSGARYELADLVLRFAAEGAS